MSERFLRVVDRQQQSDLVVASRVAVQLKRVGVPLLAFASVRLLLFEPPMSLLAANLSALSTKSQRFVTRAVATYLVTANEASAISFHGTPTFATAAAARAVEAVAPVRYPAVRYPPRAVLKGLQHRIDIPRVQKARRGC